MSNEFGLIPCKYLQFSDVSNSLPQEQKIVENLEQLNLLETIKILSKINLLLSEPEYCFEIDNQIRICEEHLDEYYREKALKKLHLPNILFHRHQILYLIKKALLNCIANFDSPAQRNLEKLGVCFLITNNFIDYPSMEEALYDKMSDFLKRIYLWKKLIPSYEMGTTPHLKHEIVRNREVFDSLSSQIVKFNYINEIFENITGISIINYINILFTIIALIFDRRKKILSGRNLISFVTDDLLISTDLNSNEVNEVLRRISLPICDYKKLITSSSEASNPYDFITFRKYPLINIDNVFICIDLHFLTDKISTGLFWLINDSLDRHMSNKFHTDWGSLYEEYTKSIFLRYFDTDNCYLNPKYKNSEDEISDEVYTEGEYLVLFENKFTIISAKSKYEENQEYLLKEIKKKFIKNERREWKGVGQLANNIEKLFGIKNNLIWENIDKDKIKKVFPVIIANENLVNSPFFNYILNKWFDYLMRRKEIESDLTVMPLLVMSVEDFEILEALISKYNIIELMSNWHGSNRNFNLTFSKYLRQLLGENSNLQPDYINQKYREWWELMKSYVFGNSSQ